MKENIILGDLINFDKLGNIQFRIQTNGNVNYTRYVEDFESGKLDKSIVANDPDELWINYIYEYHNGMSIPDKAMTIRGRHEDTGKLCNNYWKDKDTGGNNIRLGEDSPYMVLHGLYELGEVITDDDFCGDVCPNKVRIKEYEYLYDRVILKYDFKNVRCRYITDKEILKNLEVVQVLPEKYKL